MQCLKFFSSINLYLFGSLRNERSTYIQDFNCSWITKSSHSKAAIFTFLFICSKRISSLVFVIYGKASCCFNEDVHPFTYLFIISAWIILLNLRIPIYSSSLMLPFIYLFIVSTWIFVLHLISSSSLLLASLHCVMSTLIFSLEVLLVAWLDWVVLFTKQFFFKKA